MTHKRIFLIIGLFAATIYLGCILSPPSLMDDVDSVQAQISRNMLSSGDWVTAHLDGVPFLEKPPLIYWMVAVSYKIFGAHDWAARIPVALSAIALCLITGAFGIWAFGKRAGLYAGLCMSTCIGLFLFTRIILPDATLTLTIVLALWAMLRALDDEERHPGIWTAVMAVCLAAGLLLKSLIGVVFPIGAGLIYLAITHQLFSARAWKRLHPFRSLLIVLLVAAPWHILATIRNPPYFAFTFKSIPGQYHGFLWFFFINEQLLRFLNLRYPRDYDTVPRLYFWLFNLIWLFPWTVYLPATLKLSYRPSDRAGKTCLLALCLLGFVMVFFTFSTTQEYYSMPIYPALALLIGAAISAKTAEPRAIGTRAVTVHMRHGGHRRHRDSRGCAPCGHARGHFQCARLPSRGLQAFAGAHGRLDPQFVRLSAPSSGAGRGGVPDWRLRHAAGRTPQRLHRHCADDGGVLPCRAAGDGQLRSLPVVASLVNALERSPHGGLIIDYHYFWYSSVFFYTDRTGLLLNGRRFGMVYGSYAPGSPDPFIDDAQFQALWETPARYYLFAQAFATRRLGQLGG